MSRQRRMRTFRPRQPGGARQPERTRARAGVVEIQDKRPASPRCTEVDARKHIRERAVDRAVRVADHCATGDVAPSVGIERHRPVANGQDAQTPRGRPRDELKPNGARDLAREDDAPRGGARRDGAGGVGEVGGPNGDRRQPRPVSPGRRRENEDARDQAEEDESHDSSTLRAPAGLRSLGDPRGKHVVDGIAAFASDGRVVASSLPAGRAATAVARGAPSPEGIHAAHVAVIDWCEAHGRARTGVRWEVYDHWRDEPETFETAVFWLLTP